MPAETAVFNAQDYGIAPGNTPTNNTTRLNNLIASLFDTSAGPTQGNGGTIQFPMTESGTYTFNGSINVSGSPATIIFVGTCVSSYNSANTPPQVPTLKMIDTGDDFFIVNNSTVSDDDVGGIVFQDLCIAYDTSLTTGAAIKVESNSQNVRIFRVIFENCPYSVAFNGATGCSMLECTVLTGSNTTAAVTLGGSSAYAKENYIAGCLFRPLGGVTAPSVVGIAVYNSEHNRIVCNRIEGFGYGILIQPQGQAYRNHFANLSIRQYSTSSTAGGALVIQPQSGGSVTESSFTACEFAPTDANRTSLTSGGVYIDATGGTVDTIRFISCTSLNWPGPGVQILSGTNIEIMGGEYAANGTTTAGIFVGAAGSEAGVVSQIRIIGAACVGNALKLSNTQKYGVYVTDGATNVIVADCDLTGNATAAAFVGAATGGAPTNVFIRGCNVTGYTSAAVQFSSPGIVEVTDCAGYNDQGTVLQATTTAPTGTFYNTSAWANAPNGWFGPIAFYVVTTGVVTIDGVNTHLLGGAFTLSPGESASIGGTVSHFLAVGK